MTRHALRFCLLFPVLIAALIAGSAVADISGDAYWSPDFEPMGVGGRVQSITSWNGSVYIGGYFLSVTDVAANHIASFEMTDTSVRYVTNVAPLGEGLDDTVTDFCVHDGDLVAAGYFDASGGQTLHRVARWDGTQWHPFGAGLPDTWPRTVASFQGDLYVGGCRWDGASWTEALPTNGTIFELVVHDGLLYVGGSFTEALGAPCNYAFAWDGAAVADLDGGLPWPVESAVATDTGVVFSGWTDYVMGGAKRWDGAAWVDEATDFSIQELAWADGDLYASSIVHLGYGQYSYELRVKSLGVWQTVGGFAPDALGVHEGILLAEAAAREVPGRYSPGLVQYDGAVRDVFYTYSGFAGVHEAIAPLYAGVITVGSFGIADGDYYDGSALVNGSAWAPWGGISDVGTPFPGRFLDVAVSNGNVFGVYEWVDWDYSIPELVRVVPGATGMEWEIVESPDWYYGTLQNVGDVLYSIGNDELFWINPTDGSQIPIATYDLRGAAQDHCEYAGGIALCGSFSTLDEVPVGDVLHWSGGVWNDLGEPRPNLYVSAVAPMDGANLAAGVRIDGSRSAVSVWDGSSWTDLAGEFNGRIRKLIYHRNRLFAAGDFDRVDRTWAPGIAVWKTTRWVPVGSGLRGGVYSRVRDMASVGNLLYVVGNFELAGPHPAAGFATWSGDPALLTGDPSPVTEEAPQASRLLDLPSPNPFNPCTTLAFTAPADGQVMVQIYDVGGRRVRELVNETLTAGPHTRQWDGLDDGGRALPSGVYMARILAAGRDESVKMTLVR